jgi:hypothetical protein
MGCPGGFISDPEISKIKTDLKQVGSRPTFLKLRCSLWVLGSRPLGIRRGIMGLILSMTRLVTHGRDSVTRYLELLRPCAGSGIVRSGFVQVRCFWSCMYTQDPGCDWIWIRGLMPPRQDVLGLARLLDVLAFVLFMPFLRDGICGRCSTFALLLPDASLPRGMVGDLRLRHGGIRDILVAKGIVP